METKQASTNADGRFNTDPDQIIPSETNVTINQRRDHKPTVGHDAPDESDGEMTQREQLRLLIQMVRAQGQRICKLEASNYRLERKLGVDTLDHSA